MRTSDLMTGPSDGDVVRAVLAGRSDIFRLLVRRHQDALFRHAMRMVGGYDDASELVQRSFVNGFDRLATCRDPDRVGAWLFRIVANLCKDHLKSSRRRDLSIDSAHAVAIDSADPGIEVERSDMLSHVRDALDTLPDDHREAFVLKHMEGRSYDEMAELTGASVSALKMRVMRARDELRSLLEVYR